MDSSIETNTYVSLLTQIKERIRLAQQRAIYSASGELLRMYWDIGKLLSERRDKAGWGSKILERISDDLKNEFPKIKGFSVRNCQFMIQFYNEYNQELTFTKLPVSQIASQKFVLPIIHIGWAHNVIIMQRIKNVEARYWYMIQTIKNGWSRDLKGEFMPKYIGKLNFYCSIVDDTLCTDGDNKTIGLLLCQSNNRIKAEYALRDVNKPIGISEYELAQALPHNIKSGLPTIEEIEQQLNND